MKYSERTVKTVPLGSGWTYLVLAESDTIPSEAELVALCKPENLAGESKGGSTLTYSVTVHQESDDHGTLSREVLTEEDVKMKFGLFSWGLHSMAKLIRTGRVVKSPDGRFNTLKIGGLDNDTNKQYIVIFKHTDKKYSPLYVAMIGSNGAGLSIPFARDSVSKLEPEFSGIPCDNEGTRVIIFEDLGAEGDEPTADPTAEPTADPAEDPDAE